MTTQTSVRKSWNFFQSARPTQPQKKKKKEKQKQKYSQKCDLFGSGESEEGRNPRKIGSLIKMVLKCERILIILFLSLTVFTPVLFLSRRIANSTSSIGNCQSISLVVPLFFLRGLLFLVLDFVCLLGFGCQRIRNTLRTSTAL